MIRFAILLTLIALFARGYIQTSAATQVWSQASVQPPGQSIPEEARRRLRHELGNSFLVYRDRIQQELKVTSAQQERLEQFLRELLPDAIPFFHKIDDLKPEERERELGAYRPKALARLAVVLKATLTEGQRQRLRQLERQREGLFGDGESWQDLHVTDEQRQQFMATIQQTKQKIDPLLEAAQRGGNPNEIRPRVMQMRLDLESKLEALLTNAQRKQWKEMLGKPMDLSALFDM